MRGRPYLVSPRKKKKKKLHISLSVWFHALGFSLSGRSCPALQVSGVRKHSSTQAGVRRTPVKEWERMETSDTGRIRAISSGSPLSATGVKMTRAPFYTLLSQSVVKCEEPVFKLRGGGHHDATQTNVTPTLYNLLFKAAGDFWPSKCCLKSRWSWTNCKLKKKKKTSDASHALPLNTWTTCGAALCGDAPVRSQLDTNVARERRGIS